MKIKNKIQAITLVVLIIFSGNYYAQYDAMFSQYMFNEVSINPAYAGSKGAMSATMLHRQQWVNFPGRPVTTSFSLHGPMMGDKMGAGLTVLNDRIGVLNRNLIYASYAYRIKLNKNSNLSFGVMTGVDNQINKYSNLKISDANGNGVSDPTFSQSTPNLTAMNFGSGIYFNTKTFYAGLSVPRMLDNYGRFNYVGQSYKVTKLDPSKFTYYFVVGNLFKINNDLKLRANAMVKAVQNAPVQLDLGANLLINNIIWTGLSYRSNSAATLLLGVQANKQLLVSYNFDYGLNSIQKYSQGSHEIVVNYLFSYKGKKIVTPRYF
ncbi:MAG: type IX secretion system membrane protein PorP/SprF [Bacteroidota bacterium]